ncbi:PREDICTED: putative uncharacterized protein DDB_G0283431 [Branchiostoma belcheri]|uniref:Uncharacterized protein n=1 Tax=Branchiostoma belcheri TaxID=7741 RepID=A0A6P4ZB34_BRABE|nr:PREDICTED: putative uncharacterized protein DDB_G0283431 [Branchiostoma belcheri]
MRKLGRSADIGRIASKHVKVAVTERPSSRSKGEPNNNRNNTGKADMGSNPNNRNNTGTWDMGSNPNNNRNNTGKEDMGSSPNNRNNTGTWDMGSSPNNNTGGMAETDSTPDMLVSGDSNFSILYMPWVYDLNLNLWT